MIDNTAFDIRTVDRTKLRDIREVQIDTTLPCPDRIRSFVDQIGNPYCYLDNGVVVGVSFADTQASLQERLRAFACSLE